MNVDSIKIILIFALSLTSVNSFSGLKDKFKEQQKPKKISQEVLDIRDDINNTWGAIEREGTFYYLMREGLGKKVYYYSKNKKRWKQESNNFTIYSDGKIRYKPYLKDVFPLYLVDNKIFVPLTTKIIGKTGTPWKGKTIRCEKKVRFARPAPVGKIDKEGIASFKMEYLGKANSTHKEKLSNKQEFEVNFDTKECYATYKYDKKSVHKCHIANSNEIILNHSFDLPGNLENYIRGIQKNLYLQKKNLETCKVESK